jgi:hypothetical protein
MFPRKAFAEETLNRWTKKMAERKSDSGVQGEGDYRSARAYQRDIKDFMKSKSGEISHMARDAEKALEGPEGKELKKAEQKGKSKARH